jgi:hypothetical protein
VDSGLAAGGQLQAPQEPKEIPMPRVPQRPAAGPIAPKNQQNSDDSSRHTLRVSKHGIDGDAWAVLVAIALLGLIYLVASSS